MTSRRVLAYFILGAVLAWQIWQHSPSPWTWRQTAGLSLVIVGFCFWLTAHIQLGASFSLTPQARALVTTGLYIAPIAEKPGFKLFLEPFDWFHRHLRRRR